MITQSLCRWLGRVSGSLLALLALPHSWQPLVFPGSGVSLWLLLLVPEKVGVLYRVLDLWAFWYCNSAEIRPAPLAEKLATLWSVVGSRVGSGWAKCAFSWISELPQ